MPLRRLRSFAVLLPLTLAAAPSPLRFDFGDGPVASGHLGVSSQTVYTAERGHGLLPGGDVSARQLPSFADALRGDCLVARGPFFFACDLPEGTYDVTVLLGATDADSETTVKAETRRLMLERVRVPAGEIVERTFTVHLRTPALPDGGRVALKEPEKAPGVLHWDDKLTLEFNGPLTAVAGLVITPRPDALVVHLAGDSTVTDQPGEPWSAWGAMLPRFFGPGVAVANHAWSGLSLGSFKGGRRLEKILSTLRPGDYVFIQFAHNDQKEKGEDAGAFANYARHLRDYADAIRSHGGRPVFVTSMYRRRFKNGALQDTLGDYPVAMRQVAAEKDVPLIDLHEMSGRLFSALGETGSVHAFVHFPAGAFGSEKAVRDNSHFSNYGGYELARCVVEGIRENLPELAARLAFDAAPFDPTRPDDPDAFSLPLSPVREPARIPEGDGR